MESRTYFAALSFASAISSSSGPTPQGIDAGDFNLDGKTDLVVTNFGPGTASFLAGAGDGTTAAPVTFDVGPDLSGIEAADFNGDGKLDVAIIGDDLAIALGNGDGTSGPPRTSP